MKRLSQIDVVFGCLAVSIISHFYYMTATEFLRHAPKGKYDAVIVDSSDPVGTLWNACFFLLTVHVSPSLPRLVLISIWSMKLL